MEIEKSSAFQVLDRFGESCLAEPFEAALGGLSLARNKKKMTSHFEHLKHILQVNLGPVAIQLYDQMLQEEQKIQDMEITYLRSQLERVHNDSAAELKRIEEERQSVILRAKAVHQKMLTLQANASSQQSGGTPSVGSSALGGVESNSSNGGFRSGGGGGSVENSTDAGVSGGGGYLLSDLEASRAAFQFNPNAKTFEVKDDEWQKDQQRRADAAGPLGGSWGNQQQQQPGGLHSSGTGKSLQSFDGSSNGNVAQQQRFDMAGIAKVSSTGKSAYAEDIENSFNQSSSGGFAAAARQHSGGSVGWGDGGRTLAQQLALGEQQYGRSQSGMGSVTAGGSTSNGGALSGDGKQGGKGVGRMAPYSCVRLRGLPYNVSAEDIAAFFRGLDYVRESIRLGLTADGRPSGEGWVSFLSHSEAIRAVKERDRKHIGDRYVELFVQSPGERGNGDPGWEPFFTAAKKLSSKNHNSHSMGEESGAKNGSGFVCSEAVASSGGGKEEKEKTHQQKQKNKRRGGGSGDPDQSSRSQQMFARAVEMGFDPHLVKELLRGGEELLFERLLEKTDLASIGPSSKRGGIKLVDAGNEPTEWTEVKAGKPPRKDGESDDYDMGFDPNYSDYVGMGSGVPKSGRTPSGQEICFNCGTVGHISRECPRPSRDNCYQCGRPGHVAKECREGDGRGQICREYLAGTCFRKNCKFRHSIK